MFLQDVSKNKGLGGSNNFPANIQVIANGLS